jgi:mono/diheme cytochrome c family protein
MRTPLIVALAVLAFISGSGSGFAADVRHGKLIALRVCSICHAVTKAQVAGNPSAPSFQTIAMSQQFRKKGVALLFERHPKMPTFALTQEEVDDIAAYIKSLAN